MIVENSRTAEEFKKTERYKRIVGSMVQEILDRGQTPVRIAVYSGEEFLGYKVDSFWSLDDVRFKAHPSKDAEPTAHLARNLLSFMNENGYQPKQRLALNSKKKLDIVVEEINPEGEKIKELIKYNIYAGKDNKYHLN